MTIYKALYTNGCDKDTVLQASLFRLSESTNRYPIDYAKICSHKNAERYCSVSRHEGSTHFLFKTEFSKHSFTDMTKNCPKQITAENITSIHAAKTGEEGQYKSWVVRGQKKEGEGFRLEVREVSTRVGPSFSHRLQLSEQIALTPHNISRQIASLDEAESALNTFKFTCFFQPLNIESRKANDNKTEVIVLERIAHLAHSLYENPMLLLLSAEGKLEEIISAHAETARSKQDVYKRRTAIELSGLTLLDQTYKVEGHSVEISRDDGETWLPTTDFKFKCTVDQYKA